MKVSNNIYIVQHIFVFESISNPKDLRQSVTVVPFQLEREQHLEKIRQAFEESRSVQEQHRVTIARLEARASHAEEAASENQGICQLLEKKVRISFFFLSS